MNEEKYLFVVSGPSGTGKDTVVHALLEQHPELHKTVSATTRARRGEEQDGRDYHFLTVPQFEAQIAQEGLVEHACYCGNYYGTLKSEVEPFIQAGTPVILVIEVQGAGNIKRLYPGATTIFLMPPTMEELERRLRSRGTDSEQAIQNRLRRAEAEISLSADYDEHVVNDVVETCAAEIYDIIREKLAAPQ
ncbi:guanylate kinase [bacterium]|nr:guanylate kinase [bacterium]